MAVPEAAEVPPSVVRVMSTEPAASAGEVAVQVEDDEQVTAVAPAVPKAAVVAPMTKSVPVTVTAVPPSTGPTAGLTAVTAGVGR